MIRESDVDESVNRLLAHFKGRVVVRPPAKAADLAKLEQMSGTLPRDMTIVFATANGICVRLEDSKADEHIACLHDIEQVLEDHSSRASAAGLAIIRGNPSGNADWLVLDRSPVYGCVIRWNCSAPGATLMASSLGRYLHGWTDYLIERFDHQGRQRLDRVVSAFDSAFMRPRDSDLARLEKVPEVKAWFRELDSTVQGGVDFE